MATTTTPTKTKQTQPQASTTNVNISDLVSSRWNGERRTVASFRCNEQLYSAFKPVAKRLYGSVCRAVEVFMAATIAASEANVYFCSTANRPISIDKIVIERNLRPRRSFEYADEEVVDGAVGGSGVGLCHYCAKHGVRKVGAGLFTHVRSGVDYALCVEHSEELLGSGVWRVKR